MAELIGEQDDELATPNVASSLAVLAGIAASDAVCCVVLGRRSRGQDHRQATELLKGVTEVGDAMARDLSRLLSVKDDAHYGVLNVSHQRVRRAPPSTPPRRGGRGAPRRVLFLVIRPW
ncbi:hypothetical protein [Jiangella alba]|uniref:hypothetical protein n=1 Tax=Jiangella alba TaxID=561176 RepID=UPI00114C8720|nr:hypothetical protein [Jiangella alba]